MSGEIVLNGENISGLKWFGGAFLFGLGLGVASDTIDHHLLNDDGRGAEITACAQDYEGLVRVTDKEALKKLASIAKAAGIKDPEAKFVSSDQATLLGELACEQPGPDATKETVLLSTGLEALQRSGEMNGTLPSGLEWSSQITPLDQ